MVGLGLETRGPFRVRDPRPTHNRVSWWTQPLPWSPQQLSNQTAAIRNQAVEELTKYLKALVYLQVQSLTGATDFGKPELLLNKAGFKSREIAEILGKKEAAVSKTISRAKQSASEVTDE